MTSCGGDDEKVRPFEEEIRPLIQSARLRQQQPSPASLLLCCFWKGGWGSEQGKRKPEP